MKALTRALGALTLSLVFSSSAWAGEYEDAMDRFMITEVMYRYALAHNTSDVEGYANLFTDDAVIYEATMGYVYAQGRKAIMDAAKKDRGRYHPGFKEDKRSFMIMRHNITNPVVTLQGKDRASGICYVQIIGEKKGYGPVLLSQGTYEDQYVKKNGKWLISRRDVHAIEVSNWEAARELGLGKE